MPILADLPPNVLALILAHLKCPRDYVRAAMVNKSLQEAARVAEPCMLKLSDAKMLGWLSRKLPSLGRLVALEAVSQPLEDELTEPMAVAVACLVATPVLQNLRGVELQDHNVGVSLDLILGILPSTLVFISIDQGIPGCAHLTIDLLARFPSLESITLNGQGVWGVLPPLPRLRSVSLRFRNLKAAQLLQHGPFKKLETLSITLAEPMSTALFGRLVEAMPALSSLYLDVLSEQQGSSLDFRRAVPLLKTIKIKARWEPFATIVLPNANGFGCIGPDAAQVTIGLGPPPPDFPFML